MELFSSAGSVSLCSKQILKGHCLVLNLGFCKIKSYCLGCDCSLETKTGASKDSSVTVECLFHVVALI
jgi:hypothetical protein